MALASGPFSFQRFFIGGQFPGDVTDQFVKTLNDHAFGHSPPLPDDTQIGWIGPTHLFETELVGERIACGPFAHLAVRMDRLKPPPSVVKAYIQMEHEAARAASGQDVLNRGQQRQAREAALTRAEQEARAGSFRRIGASPILIDLQHQMLYLGNLSPAMGDKVMQLFYDTFGCQLEPVDPERVAERTANAAKRTRELESLTPFALVDPPDEFGERTIDFAGVELNFLGKELLTWLWYHTDQEAGTLQVSSGDDITVMIDKTVRLKCDFGLTGTNVISADGPCRLPEARAALGIGKQPTKMGLIIGSPAGEFRLTLDGERLGVSSLVVPESEQETDPQARLEQRFELITDAATIVDALFELYLERRLSREWTAELRRMSEWAAGKATKPLRAASA